MSYWKNKVINLTMEVPEDLLANPYNPRRHPPEQREMLRASLDELGWIAPIVVNDHTGRVVDGHARIEEAITAGIPNVPVVHVLLTEDEERLAVAVLDPIAGFAINDQERLDDLIASIHTENIHIEALLSVLSGEEVDAKPIHVPGRSDKRTIVLVYDDAEYSEVVGGLSLCPGHDASDKVIRLVRAAIG